MKKTVAAFVLLFSALSLCFAVKADKKKVKRTIDEVKLGKFEQTELGFGSVRMKKIIGTELESIEYTVILYPEDGTTGIFYKKGLGSKESLRLDADARQALRDAYASYLKDYEEKKLEKKKKKFTEVYGVARAKIVWGIFRETATAYPKIHFGYTFVGKSPYFVIKVADTKADKKKGDLVVEYIGNLIYFTRAQVKELLDCLEEEDIQETISSMTVELPKDEDYEEDYEEAESAVKAKADDQQADYEEESSGAEEPAAVEPPADYEEKE